jgi:transposase
MPNGGPRARKSDTVYEGIANDLRHGSWSQKALAAHYQVSTGFVSKVAANITTYGTARAPSQVQGAPRKVTAEMEDALKDLIDEHKTVLLDEAVDFLQDEFDVTIHRATAGRVLARLNLTYKRVTAVHPSQDPGLRADHLAERIHYRADQIVALDESAADEKTADRKFGWSLRGLPCRVRQAGRRGRRWSVLPAMTTDGYLAWRVYEGSFNAERFKEFIIEDVLPKMGNFFLGQSHSVLLLDNASSHRSAMSDPDLVDALNDAGVIVCWLPPYSPDFNPIEQSFNELKQWMRRHRSLSYDFGDYFEGFVNLAVESVCSAEHARGYFRDCGYEVVNP